MIDIHLDLEWRSDVEIKLGPNAYFGSPRSQPLMASFAFTGGEVQRWLPGEPTPAPIREHAAAGGVFVAHNAANFERHAWRIMTRDHGWPELKLEQWRDTMAAACAMGLPADLETLAIVLGLPQKKDKIGKALIKFFCIPRADGEFNDPNRLENRDRFEQFRDYCDQDVRTEMGVDIRLVPLSSGELRAWRLDQRINDRGIRVDRVSAWRALALIEQSSAHLDQRISEATAGAVRTCNSHAALTRWLADQNFPLEGVAKDDILEALEIEDLPPHVQNVLEIRQAAAKTSTAKLKKLLAFSEKTGRIEHRYRFHGTGPGRWTCLDPNLFNLPRPRKEYGDAVEEGLLDYNQAFEIMRQGSPELLETVYGPDLGQPMSFVADSLRGFLWAAPGHDLIAVDYSGIQGALAAWFAGEEWKLAAMQEIIDDPKGKPDLYRRAAAGILNTTTDIVTKKHWGRQIGKVAELALGFAGGVSALVSMSRNYLLRRRQLHDLFPGVWAAASVETRQAAEKRYEQVRRSRRKEESDMLTREAWLACSLIVRGWRATNPRIKESWTLLENAVRDAVRRPGEIVTTLKGVQYLVRGGYLWCRLPSGRCIAYASPKLKEQVWARVLLDDGSMGEAEVIDGDEARALVRAGKAKIEGETSPKVTVATWEGKGHNVKTLRYALYGGLIMENLCLASERDILLNGIVECEANGYPIVFHCYDEAVAEVPRGRGSVEEMIGLMMRLPAWTTGLPLGAAGWKNKRYHK